MKADEQTKQKRVALSAKSEDIIKQIYHCYKYKHFATLA